MNSLLDLSSPVLATSSPLLVQQLVNRVNLADDFQQAAEVYKSALPAQAARAAVACWLLSSIHIITYACLHNHHTFADGGPPPRPNLPHGVVLGVAPSGVVGYNCNYQNFPELADGEVFDMQTCVHPPLLK